MDAAALETSWAAVEHWCVVAWSDVESAVAQCRAELDAITTAIANEAAHDSEAFLRTMGITPQVATIVAATVDAVVESGGAVFSGTALAAPDLLIRLVDMPESISRGTADVATGFQDRDWERLLAGIENIATTFGAIAGDGLAFASFRAKGSSADIKVEPAVLARDELDALRKGVDQGLQVELVGRAATGKTEGLAIHRLVRDAEGSLIEKRTVVVSNDGRVITAHTDSYGRFGGLRSRIDLDDARGVFRHPMSDNPGDSPSVTGPAFPEEWTGFREVRPGLPAAEPNSTVADSGPDVLRLLGPAAASISSTTSSAASSKAEPQAPLTARDAVGNPPDSADWPTRLSDLSALAQSACGMPDAFGNPPGSPYWGTGMSDPSMFPQSACGLPDAFGNLPGSPAWGMGFPDAGSSSITPADSGASTDSSIGGGDGGGDGGGG